MFSLKVHHLGYLVKKKEAAKKAFSSLGYEVTDDWVHDELRGVDLCFMKKDNLLVELVCPFSDDSVVSGLKKRNGNGPYHICYVSESIEKDAETLRDLGYLPTTEAEPAPAFGGKNVQFFIHPMLGMIELVEE